MGVTTDRRARVTEIVMAALAEVDGTRGVARAEGLGPDTIFVGEPDGLDSLGFVVFAVTVQESIERAFRQPLNVLDIVAAGDAIPWTVGSLATRIDELLGRPGDA